MALSARSGAQRVRVTSGGLHGRLRLVCNPERPLPPPVSIAVQGRATFLWTPGGAVNPSATVASKATFLWVPGTGSLRGRLTLACTMRPLLPPVQLRSQLAIACTMVTIPPVHPAAAVAGRMTLRWVPGVKAAMRSAARFSAAPKIRARMMSEAAFTATMSAITGFANGYTYRARIRIPTSSVIFTSARPFVLFINETLLNLRSVANLGKVESSVGRDIRFELTDGSKLSHILDTYEPVSGHLVAWVNIPNLVPAQNNDLFIYIGKAGLSATEADPAGATANYIQWLNPLTGVDLTGQAGRSLTPTSITAGDLGLGVAGDFDGTSSVAAAAPWTGFGGWSEVTLDLWYKADSDAVGGTRNIFAQGPKTGANQHSIALFWRADSEADATIHNIIQGNITCALNAAGQAAAISLGSQQTSNLTHIVLRWASGEAPGILLNGVPISLSVSDIGTGTVAVQSGNVMLGDGPSTTLHPGLKWKGLLGAVRLRALKLTDRQVQTEYANQLDPRSFYGFGGWDAWTDTNQAPVAVPEVAWEVTTNAATLLDVLANDFEPDGDTKSIASGSVSAPPHGTASISSGKVSYTSSSGYVGPDSFNYAVSDGSKRSTGKVLVTVVGTSPPPPPPPPGGDLAWLSGFTGDQNDHFATWRNRAPQVMQLNASAHVNWPSFANSDNWRGLVDSCLAAGAMPVLNMPQIGPDETFAQVAAATAGDGGIGKAIHDFAVAYKAKLNGRAGVCRIGWEPSNCTQASYYWSWCKDATNNYANYKESWRKIVEIIRAVFAINTVASPANNKLITCWSMQKNGIPLMADTFPGSGWVDDVGIDMYDASTEVVKTNDGVNLIPNSLLTGKLDDVRNFASAHSCSWSVDEWGLRWVHGTTHGGLDNPFFIQAMFNYFVAHPPRWESYYRPSKKWTVDDDSTALIYYESGSVHVKGPWSGPSQYVNGPNLAQGFAGYNGAYVGSGASTASGLAGARYLQLFGG